MSEFLTPDQLAHFHEKGYLVLPGMASPGLVARIRAESETALREERAPIEYEAEVGYEGAPESLEATGGRTVRRLRGAYQRAACLRDWAGDARLLHMLRQLLDEVPVLTLAHHNCVMTKHPHYGTATGWHRDIRYWRYERNALISVWLALGSERGANGGLRVLPGSQHWQLAPGQLDEMDFLRTDVAENQALVAGDTVVELDAGDVLLFHSGLFHAAGRNESEAVKMSAVFAYRGESNLPLAGSRSSEAGEVAFE